jgi:hypothetical protein
MSLGTLRTRIERVERERGVGLPTCEVIVIDPYSVPPGDEGEARAEYDFAVARAAAPLPPGHGRIVVRLGTLEDLECRRRAAADRSSEDM